MQQKKKNYELHSPSFNDPLFKEQWYIVSYLIIRKYNTENRNSPIWLINITVLPLLYNRNIVYMSIGNHMISSAIWNK